MSSLAPPFEISAYASTGRSSQTRSAGQPCRTFAERGECPFGSRCRFAHPTPPTPTTASTLDLDPFNPTNDDPISPIYPAKKSSFAHRNKSKWPSSPLSYQQFGGGDDQRHQLQPEPIHFDQLQQHVLLAGGSAGGSYGQWQDTQAFYAGYTSVSSESRSSGRRGQSSYRTVPCRNFLAGHCPRGGMCSFKHEVPSSIVREPPSDESHIELDFAHLSLIGADGTVPVVPQPPAAKEVIGTKGERIQINGLATPLVASVPPGARRKDRTVPGAMVNGLRPSAHPLYKTRQCKYWAPNGTGSCTKGAACAFLHPGENEAPVVGADGVLLGGGLRQEGRHPKFRTESCLFFNRGTCTRGDECNFAHVLAPSRLPTSAPVAPGATPVAPLGRKACLYLLRNVECPFGPGRCRYRHSILPVDRAAFAAAEQQAALEASKASFSPSRPAGSAIVLDDETDDDEGDVEIVLEHPGSPVRTASRVGESSNGGSATPTMLRSPATPGKRRTQSMGEVDSPSASQGR